VTGDAAVTIWHNPRCSKSRAALALIRERGIEPAIRLYLQDPPTEAELAEALKALEIGPAALLRRSEPEFRALALASATEPQILAAMAAHPKLIERPVVFTGKGAAIGRPTEAILPLL